MDTEQVEGMLTTAWGRRAYVNRYRLAGNRSAYAANDGNGHYLSLFHYWRNGELRLRPAAGTWEDLALDAAIERARAWLADDPATSRRLEKAIQLVHEGAVRDLGNGQWAVKGGDDYYLTNGSCTCADYQNRGGYCKHRLAVLLVRKSREIMAAGGAVNTPAAELAPEGDTTQGQYTTDCADLQDHLADWAEWRAEQADRWITQRGG